MFIFNISSIFGRGSAPTDDETSRAYIDRCTGIPNRVYLEKAAQLRKHADNYTITVLNVGNLHEVNNKYGRVTGEKLIKASAQILQGVTRKKAIVSRDKSCRFLILTDSRKAIDEIMAGMEGKLKAYFKARLPDLKPQLAYSTSKLHGAVGESIARAEEDLDNKELQKYLRKNRTEPRKIGLLENMLPGEMLKQGLRQTAATSSEELVKLYSSLSQEQKFRIAEQKTAIINSGLEVQIFLSYNELYRHIRDHDDLYATILYKTTEKRSDISDLIEAINLKSRDTLHTVPFNPEDKDSKKAMRTIQATKPRNVAVSKNTNLAFLLRMLRFYDLHNWIKNKGPTLLPAYLP